MIVYIAVVQENEYETEPFNLGVYSTKEKAEKDILRWIRETDSDSPALSLETYEAQDEPRWIYNIEEREIE